MSIAARMTHQAEPALQAQPNELDLRRVQNAIKARKRYRYVSPDVRAVPNGYLIRSENCSRNIDPEGGEIDIALIRWIGERNEWELLRKDHAAGSWVEDSRYARLPELLLRINHDPQKSFWQ